MGLVHDSVVSKCSSGTSGVARFRTTGVFQEEGEGDDSGVPERTGRDSPKKVGVHPSPGV